MTQFHESTPEISPATSEDLLPLVELEEAVSMEKYPSEELGITPEDIAAIGWGALRVRKYRERFLDNPQAGLWVAKKDGTVVGFVAASKGDGQWIRKLYVASGYQHNGIGSLLLARAESWLDDETVISLGVALYDDAAKQFYTKHGYVATYLRPDRQTTVPATGKVIRELLFIKQTHAPRGSR